MIINNHKCFFSFDQVLSKYDKELAGQLLEWIKEIAGEDIKTDGSADNFYETLKDGQVLCR